MYKQARTKKSEIQPKCHVGICRRLCPFMGAESRISIVGLSDGKDAVCFMREMRRGEWTSCMIAYLNGRCMVGEDEIEKDALGFMGRHHARIMNDECPLKMEHMLYGWNNGRKKKQL